MKTRIIRRGGTLPLACMGLLAAALLPISARAEVVLGPKHVGASLDLGQLHEGNVQGEIEDFPLTRTGIYMGLSAVRDENLELRVTMGGLFWYAASQQTDAVNRLVKYGAGVGEAQGIYSFGDAKDPSARLRFGLFPVKYTDAHNLGEYLYRSGAYPGYMTSGGWSYLQSASYLAQGVRLTLPTLGGKVTHQFSVLMERGWEPLYDLSPSYEVSVKPVPFVEVGGGVQWAHAIALRSGRDLSLRTERNAYSKTTDMPVAGASAYGVNDSVVFIIPGDPGSGIDTIISDTTTREAQTLRDWQACQAGDCRNIGYYTFRGFKGVLHASLDLGTLLEVRGISPGDFKVYAEGALLGFQNYPYYYDDPMERMPVMAGVNIPTFGLLDRFSAEVEYRKSRFVNTVYGVNRERIPVPLTSSGGSGPDAYSYLGKDNTDDDWRWSFYASRQLTEGVSLHGQIASDHQRHPDFWGVLGNEPATTKTTEWYYVFRLAFGF
jgi:hypothetical protein